MKYKIKSFISKKVDEQFENYFIVLGSLIQGVRTTPFTSVTETHIF